MANTIQNQVAETRKCLETLKWQFSALKEQQKSAPNQSHHEAVLDAMA